VVTVISLAFHRIVRNTQLVLSPLTELELSSRF
jgi:hypothetical protein